MDQAVIVYLILHEDPFGSPREREAITTLTDALEGAINEFDVGEFDGEEFGGGRCVLYMYGPDADRLFATVESILKVAPAARGGFAILRYGEAKDPGAAEIKVDL